MLWLRSLVVLFLLAPLALAGDWPQWLGPNRDGSTTEKVAVWKEAPKVVWKQPVGEGNSSPVIASGRVFVHSKIKDKTEEEVVAYDARTGQEQWRYSYERVPFKSAYGNGPRATPAVVDGKVYAFGITGVLTCLDAAKGTKVWQVDTLTKFKGKNLFFGLASSPLVEQGRVLVDVGAKGASIVALDGKTGEAAWKSLDDGASYSSPIAFGDGKQRQVVFLTAAGLVSLEAASGELVWRFPLRDRLFESSTTPVKVGNRIVASSITYGSACLKLETKDGKPAFQEVWKNPELTCYFSTPVPIGSEHLYLVTGMLPLGGRPEATLHCVDLASGKSLWKKPKVGEYHAALLRTGDGKLLMHQDNGELVLLDPNPKEYKELCRAKVCGHTWAHPALANGLLYVRDNKELICLRLSK